MLPTSRLPAQLHTVPRRFTTFTSAKAQEDDNSAAGQRLDTGVQNKCATQSWHHDRIWTTEKPEEIRRVRDLDLFHCFLVAKEHDVGFEEKVSTRTQRRAYPHLGIFLP